MSLRCTDPSVTESWLVAGSLGAMATASEVQPWRTMLLDQEVALWHDAQGALHARCDGDPLLVQARYGYAWICPGGRPARELFAFPEYEEQGRRIVDCGPVGVGTSGLRVIENFLDMAHFPYVHAHYLGELPHTEVTPYKVDVDETTGEIWATDCRFWQPRSSAAHAEGSDAAYIYRVMQPFAAMLYKSSSREGARDAIGLFVQPVSETRVIAHTVLAYFDDVSSDAELVAFQHTIFGQDKPILENHRPQLLPLEGRMETPTRADTMSVTYRRWLRERGHRYGTLATPRSMEGGA
ncbi:aromatic ring-hydroxylating dioxygenase subunit alpha [Variovorax dokdonensis]|uniref:Aromatic ring-hydroxylating dioxygenase subunit alpha n=1 Tax=Variovorax dokdonensis TaxID=344883 RepID=A0ABT7N8S5_9BURK|nr:aromatic ring-hydroxylating dioxygenase subunit alpha [Variovorax dokdonensis]MDM0044270.1 aromatic ring-hydroxylating dioxygenase subunit alpha [Variovorax dokdonensis]